METPQSSATPLVILNPAANRSKMGRHREAVRVRAARESAEYVETTGPGQAKELALTAAKEGRPVIIIGGDGSVHEAVNGILGSGRRVPLGIIAAGSGNDFAWNTLKLPRDPVAAIEHAFGGRLVAVDAGTVNGCYFVNSFSVGLDADIAVAANRMRNIPLISGEQLYYASTVKQLVFGYHRCPWLSFELDQDEPAGNKLFRRCVLMAVTNGPTYGAGFRINPTADATDGLFDICTIDYLPLFRALKLLPIIKKGEHAGLAEVKFYRAKSVYIESQDPVNMQMDGETASSKCYNARILPGALWVRI